MMSVQSKVQARARNFLRTGDAGCAIYKVSPSPTSNAKKPMRNGKCSYRVRKAIFDDRFPAIMHYSKSLLFLFAIDTSTQGMFGSYASLSSIATIDLERII